MSEPLRLTLADEPNRGTPSRRGRPPAKEPGQRLSLWLPNSEIDELYRRARRLGVPGNKLARWILWTSLGQRS
jgi:hypothetical protein